MSDSDTCQHGCRPARKRGLWSRLPLKLRRFLMHWIMAMLITAWAGYTIYAISGRWEPAHIGHWLRALVGGV